MAWCKYRFFRKGPHPHRRFQAGRESIPVRERAPQPLWIGLTSSQGDAFQPEFTGFGRSTVEGLHLGGTSESILRSAWDRDGLLRLDLQNVVLAAQANVEHGIEGRCRCHRRAEQEEPQGCARWRCGLQGIAESQVDQRRSSGRASLGFEPLEIPVGEDPRTFSLPTV